MTPVAGSVAVTMWVPAVRWMIGSGLAGSMRRVSDCQRAVPGRLVTGRSLSEPEGISGSSRKVALSAGLMMRSGSRAGCAGVQGEVAAAEIVAAGEPVGVGGIEQGLAGGIVVGGSGGGRELVGRSEVAAGGFASAGTSFPFRGSMVMSTIPAGRSNQVGLVSRWSRSMARWKIGPAPAMPEMPFIGCCSKFPAQTPTVNSRGEADAPVVVEVGGGAGFHRAA